MTLGRRVAAEGIGTAFLVATVVGSGIMAERLAQGNTALALLANAVATGAVLVALILTLEGVSAHFNPLVSLVAAAFEELPFREIPAYICAQIGGAILGVALTNALFTGIPFAPSHHSRSGAAQLGSEVLATFGLILVVRGARFPALAVGSYIVAAYWFCPSTSFANPAVTIGRALTESFAGIRPLDVPGFIGAQGLGALLAGIVARWLFCPGSGPFPRDQDASREGSATPSEPQGTAYVESTGHDRLPAAAPRSQGPLQAPR